MLSYISHTVIPNVPMAASINVFESGLCISMVFHVGTLSQCASMLRPCGGGEGTDFFVQPNLTIESNNFGVMEVWPKPWDFNIRNHIFQVFRSLAMILHANKQEVGGLVNIIIGLPQRLLHPLPGKAHVCEGGHQNWAGRRLTSLLWSSWLTSSSSAAHTLPSPKLVQPHLSASSARGLKDYDQLLLLFSSHLEHSPHET